MAQHRGPPDKHNTGEINADLAERFRHRPSHEQFQNSHLPSNMLLPFEERLKEYFNVNHDSDSEPWASSPEFPLAEELNETQAVNTGSVNIINKPWESKADYLKAHYELLREDALLPLREAVRFLLENPQAKEPSPGSIGIYEDTHITGLTFCNRGLGVKVSFSLRRAGKQVKWSQSKRLVSGSLVVLVPASASARFCSPSIIVAIVAARPLSGLEKETPEIDLFFARPCDLEIDTHARWTMVENRNGFFEAQRHTLLALQKMMHEKFPLSEHLVALQEAIESPRYIKEHSTSGVHPDELEESQQAALERLLTKRLALVQGPPGTGKTYVSTLALDIMCRNMGDESAPIVIACQTNHALDQILRKIAAIWPDCFVRLGSRSGDREVVQQRTLYNLRENMALPQSSRRRFARKKIRDLTKRMKAVLEPFQKESGPLKLECLQRLGVLNEAQCDSIRASANAWVTANDSNVQTELEKWVGDEFRSVSRIPRLLFPEVEEAELDIEELNEVEAENAKKSDEEQFELLKGEFVALGVERIGNVTSNAGNVEQVIFETQDMSKTRIKIRGAVYNFLVRRAKEIARTEFRQLAIEYLKAVEEHKTGKWVEDAFILQQSKIIGVTTTGFSKYRPLIAAVQPKVVLIEEAAETLEAPVTVTCLNSLEHLILVGDHKQLRPHCQARELEDEPYNLNISLFERLVNNKIPFSLLKRQRRMIPGVRRLLRPFYGDAIEDHPLVKSKANRPPVPGMGKKSTWFYNHGGPEAKDDQLSYYNEVEAAMIVEFVRYLLCNGLSATEITVITFYSGQKQKLLLFKRRCLGDPGQHVKVTTVDSYQGEENGVVILSLVRNNPRGNIGFLAVDNRVCVALSRAQRGLYIFGNGELLCGESRVWCNVIKIMYGLENEGRRIGFTLPLQCEKHKRKTWVENLQDWENIAGGCDIICHEPMPCGHACMKFCHPAEQHDCKHACDRRLPCSHLCVEGCIDPCRCRRSEDSSNGTRGRNQISRYVQAVPGPREQSNQLQPIGAWNDFAETGCQQRDQQIQLIAEENGATVDRNLLDQLNYDMLFGEDPTIEPLRNEPVVRVYVLESEAPRYRTVGMARQRNDTVDQPEIDRGPSLLD